MVKRLQPQTKTYGYDIVFYGDNRRFPFNSYEIITDENKRDCIDNLQKLFNDGRVIKDLEYVGYIKTDSNGNILEFIK